MLLFGRLCLARELCVLRPASGLDELAPALKIYSPSCYSAVDALFRTCSLVPDALSGVPLLATENYWTRSGQGRHAGRRRGRTATRRACTPHHK